MLHTFLNNEERAKALFLFVKMKSFNIICILFDFKYLIIS